MAGLLTGQDLEPVLKECGDCDFVMLAGVMFRAGTQTFLDNMTAVSYTHLVEKTKIRSLFLSSMFAGVTAIVQLSHGSGVTPSVGLDSIQNIMQPIMSVFIGFVMAQYINLSLIHI